MEKHSNGYKEKVSKTLIILLLLMLTMSCMSIPNIDKPVVTVIMSEEIIHSIPILYNTETGKWVTKKASERVTIEGAFVYAYYINREGSEYIICTNIVFSQVYDQFIPASFTIKKSKL